MSESLRGALNRLLGRQTVPPPQEVPLLPVTLKTEPPYPNDINGVAELLEHVSSDPVRFSQELPRAQRTLQEIYIEGVQGSYIIVQARKKQWDGEILLSSAPLRGQDNVWTSDREYVRVDRSTGQIDLMQRYGASSRGLPDEDHSYTTQGVFDHVDGAPTNGRLSRVAYELHGSEIQPDGIRYAYRKTFDIQFNPDGSFVSLSFSRDYSTMDGKKLPLVDVQVRA